tara:strand:- start:15 stop:884 length:870 start_codon:yes stop_codon:yes gene_type:complete
MRILITGASGFIGRNVMDYCQSGAHHLIHYDEQLPDRHVFDRFLKSKGEDHTPIEAVVHLAALPSVPRSIQYPGACFKTNVEGTFHLIQEAVKHGVKRFIFASSAAAETPGVSPYAASKAAGEHFLEAACRHSDMQGIALRFANVYGPHSMHKESAVAALFKALYGETPFVVNGTGEQRRDYVFAGDIARALSLAVGAPLKAFHVVPIGSGVITSINSLIAAIETLTGRTVQIQRGSRAGDVDVASVRLAAAHLLIGYSPAFDLVDGLQKTAEYFEAESKSHGEKLLVA